MKKNEFLRELENALKYKLSQEDINEIISDYTDIFNSGIKEGKSEDDVSNEIGSPAKIARTILDETNGVDELAIKNNNKDDTIKQDVRQLAPMSKRLGAYIIDAITMFLVFALILLLSFAFYTTGTYSTVNESVDISENQQGAGQDEDIYRKVTHNYDSSDKPKETVIELYKNDKKIFKGSVNEYREFRSNNRIKEDEISVKETINHKPFKPLIGISSTTFVFTIINTLMLFMFLGIANILTALQLYFFKGYTLGKWIMKIKVQKINGEKISFGDAVLRDVLLKCIGNALTSGILNVGSFIWGCVTDEHKTVHDLASKTKVVNVMR
ncbi:MAG: RDD family protein [Clostridia bacterium]|nr:RDD family protein [Clostridia bacterium]